ncbi:MAG: hypothetical protein HQM10_26415, partial [Candidatus Riflebacteria bacterium]|nr:hypothetical protein [Candidatus Riflebacteria bacterium]
IYSRREKSFTSTVCCQRKTVVSIKLKFSKNRAPEQKTGALFFYYHILKQINSRGSFDAYIDFTCKDTTYGIYGSVKIGPWSFTSIYNFTDGFSFIADRTVMGVVIGGNVTELDPSVCSGVSVSGGEGVYLNTKGKACLYPVSGKANFSGMVGGGLGVGDDVVSGAVVAGLSTSKDCYSNSMLK